MITPDFRKKMADSWFSYLQIQICKEFEFLEKNRIVLPKFSVTFTRFQISTNP